MGCPSPAAPRAAAPRARAGRPASLDRPASMAPPATRTHRIGGARPVCAQVYVVRDISARRARLRRLMPCPRCIRSVGAASSRAILARRHRPRPVLARAHCAGHHATAESHLVLLWAGPRAVGGVLGAGRGNELREAQQEQDAPSAPGWSRAARHVAAAHGDDVCPAGAALHSAETLLPRSVRIQRVRGVHRARGSISNAEILTRGDRPTQQRPASCSVILPVW